MPTHRVKNQHVRNWCFQGPVKAKPSFSRINPHVWAVATTFYYSTSYTLFESSSISHDFSDQNCFPEYLRIAMGLMVERIFFIPPEPSPFATQPAEAQTWDAPTTVTGATPTLQCSCFHDPGTPPQRHFVPSPVAARLNAAFQTGCHPQAFSQLQERVCTHPPPQVFLTADKRGS